MFKDRKTYPNLGILEDNYEAILSEFKSIHGIGMREWPEHDKYIGSWKVFGLYHCGRKLESCCERMPETTRIIESVGKVYMAGFSRMAQKTQILPHVDDVPDGLHRVHLGIQVPPGLRCGFWVDGENTLWKNGKAFAFDPKKIHKAWNMTDEDRIILLLDFEKFH